MKAKYFERITPGTNLFKQEYPTHIVRYKFARENLITRGCKGRVLDLGCGTGYGTFYLADQVNLNLFGIDINQQAIDFACMNFQRQNINFEKMAATSLRFGDNFFDAIISFEVIEHVMNPELFLREAKRVLKKGGIIILSTPNKNMASKNLKKPKNPFHAREYTDKEFFEILSKFFSQIQIYGQYLTNNYYEKKESSRIINKLLEEKTLEYVNLVKKFLPSHYLRHVPKFIRSRIGKMLHESGRKKYEFASKSLQKRDSYPALYDLEIDGFHLDESSVLVAIATKKY